MSVKDKKIKFTRVSVLVSYLTNSALNWSCQAFTLSIKNLFSYKYKPYLYSRFP